MNASSNRGNIAGTPPRARAATRGSVARPERPESRSGTARTTPPPRLRTLLSFIERYGSKNTVLIMLGDEQPSTVISQANHEVPITIIAHDPKVIARLSNWDWTNGMLPSATAPDWPMSAFRNRFLNAFDH